MRPDGRRLTMSAMRARRIATGLGMGLVLLAVAAGCGGGDGERPDVTLPSTTSTEAGAAGSSTSTTEATPTTEATTTTRPEVTTTTRAPLTTTTSEAVTTTAPQATTSTTEAPGTTAATATDEATAPPTTSTDDSTSWWWILLPILLALVGFLLWKRSKTGPPWAERAAAFAAEVDAAGRSVLLGPDLTDELWASALSRSNAVRAEAEGLLDHSPTSAARQAVNEATEALRHAEIQATAARSGVGGAGDRDAAAAELAAAVQRLQAVATSPVAPTP